MSCIECRDRGVRKLAALMHMLRSSSNRCLESTMERSRPSMASIQMSGGQDLRKQGQSTTRRRNSKLRVPGRRHQAGDRMRAIG